MIYKLISAGKKVLNYSEMEFSRYKSWEFCHKKFIESYNEKENLTEKDYDLLALHLGFYLASWGMYRGSTFLLQANYKIHVKIVKKIIESKAFKEKIWEKEILNDNDFKNIIDLKEKISEYLNSKEIKLYKDGKPIDINVTDTLLSKIIMGTLGVVPAYDTYFKIAISEINKTNEEIKLSPTFDEESLKNLYKYYEKYASRFDTVTKRYPKMKILDMCFWQFGLEEDKRRKKSKIENKGEI